jgi:hypothetical protein
MVGGLKERIGKIADVRASILPACGVFAILSLAYRDESTSLLEGFSMQQHKTLENTVRIGALISAALILLGLPAAVFADRISDVEALEAQCEKEREAKIKPLREMEIAKCKADSHNDPSYCERYWRDYGNAVGHPNGTMSPRMFNDLPICVAAFEARKALINRDGGR